MLSLCEECKADSLLRIILAQPVLHVMSFSKVNSRKAQRNVSVVAGKWLVIEELSVVLEKVVSQQAPSIKNAIGSDRTAKTSQQSPAPLQHDYPSVPSVNPECFE